MRIALVAASVLALMLPEKAVAADTAIPYAPGLQQPGYDWSGIYIGGETGGASVSSRTTVVTQGTPLSGFPAGTVQNTISQTGWLGGAYAGYNRQAGHLVLGIDGNFNATGLRGTGSETSPINGAVASHTLRVTWVGTLTGRVGVALDKFLLFGKAGWALAHFSDTSTENNGALLPSLVSTATSSETRNGWTAGGGLEWALGQVWVARLEYDYIRFLTANFNAFEVDLPAGTTTQPARSAQSSMNLIKVGLAYKF